MLSRDANDAVITAAAAAVDIARGLTFPAGALPADLTDRADRADRADRDGAPRGLELGDAADFRAEAAVAAECLCSRTDRRCERRAPAGAVGVAGVAVAAAATAGAAGVTADGNRIAVPDGIVGDCDGVVEHESTSGTSTAAASSLNMAAAVAACAESGPLPGKRAPLRSDPAPTDPRRSIGDNMTPGDTNPSSSPSPSSDEKPVSLPAGTCDAAELPAETTAAGGSLVG